MKNANYKFIKNFDEDLKVNSLLFFSYNVI